jgi:cytochrome c oxidase subunit II
LIIYCFDYKKWISEQVTLVDAIKSAAAPAPVDGATGKDSTKTNDTATAVKIAMK